MALSIELVFEKLGFVFRDAKVVSLTPGVTCLGTIDQIPLDESSSISIRLPCMVWHAEDGWAPIDRMEMERWQVDAPSGNHWFISQRRLVDVEFVAPRDDLEVVIWSSDHLAAWIGNKVLEGRLEIGSEKPTQSFSSVKERTETSQPPEVKATALRPKVQLAKWLSDRGYERLQVRPVLLEGRIWRVSGELLGPEGAREPHRWTILEDPFTGSVDRLNEVDSLPFVPQLDSISPNSWRSESSIRGDLPSVCEERRHWRVKESSHDGVVKGSLLHWWKIEEESAILESSQVLMPGWQVKFPDTGWKIVHGLTGATSDFEQDINRKVAP